MTAAAHLTPAQAVDLLAQRYDEAAAALRAAVERFLHTGVAPSDTERAKFRYPALRVTYRPEAAPPANPRAFAKFSAPGVYTTTVTQPADFRAYLLEQLTPLVAEYGADIEVGVGAQEIAYPYVFETGDELGRGGATAADLARYFPDPLACGDRRRDRRRAVRRPPRRRAAAGAVRRGARRLFAAPPRALHRLRLARDAALGAADQLSPLCRSVRALGPGAVARRRRRRHGWCCRAT